MYLKYIKPEELKEGDVGVLKVGKINLTVSLGLYYPNYPDHPRRWVKVLVTNGKFKKGMTFVGNMENFYIHE